VQSGGADRIAGRGVPRANIANLMLDPETVDAVARGTFHIYPVDSIDRGIELLTGVRAGSLDEPGTINYLGRSAPSEDRQDSARSR